MKIHEWEDLLRQAVSPAVAYTERLTVDGHNHPKGEFRFELSSHKVDPVTGIFENRHEDPALDPDITDKAYHSTLRMITQLDHLLPQTVQIAQNEATAAKRSRFFKGSQERTAQEWAKRASLVGDFLAAGRQLLSSADAAGRVNQEVFLEASKRLLNAYDSFVPVE